MLIMFVYKNIQSTAFFFTKNRCAKVYRSVKSKKKVSTLTEWVNYKQVHTGAWLLQTSGGENNKYLSINQAFDWDPWL